MNQMTIRFDGSDIDQLRDGQRLTGQLKEIKRCLLSGDWLSLQDLEKLTGFPQASISAQIRNLRKERFGSHEIEKRHVKGGLFYYRLAR